MKIFLSCILLLASISAFSKAVPVCKKKNPDGSTTTTSSDGSCPKGSVLTIISQ